MEHPELKVPLLLGEEGIINGRVTPTAGAPVGSGDGERVYTPQEIAQHCTVRDCWVVVHGGVYDVTQFLQVMCTVFCQPPHPPRYPAV